VGDISPTLYPREKIALRGGSTPNAVTHIRFRANNSFYDREKYILYYLSITYDEKTALDKYEILEYSIDMR
jgi:hypothetical protein